MAAIHTCSICDTKKLGFSDVMKTKDKFEVCDKCRKLCPKDMAKKIYNYTLEEVKEKVLANTKYTEIFHPTTKIGTFLEIDDEKKLWRRMGTFNLLSAPNKYELTWKASSSYNYDCIKSCEIIEKEKKKAINFIVVGGIIGFLFTPVGFIIGAIIGFLLAPTKVTDISVRVYLKESNYESMDICIFHTGSIKKKSSSYVDFINSANEVKEKLISLSPLDSKNVVQFSNNATFGADEILKLKELVDKGIITEEEFNIKKSKIINS